MITLIRKLLERYGIWSHGYDDLFWREMHLGPLSLFETECAEWREVEMQVFGKVVYYKHQGGMMIIS